jgi:predicted outer membrane repeat protein
MASRTTLGPLLLAILVASGCPDESQVFDFDGDGDPDETDCAPEDPDISRLATEACDDGVDNDCDGAVDGDDNECADPDLDGDGYTSIVDCDDTDASVYPGATEVCDEVDNDCDGDVDEDDSAGMLVFHADTDGDEYGDAGATIDACVAPEGYVGDATDCDDSDPAVYPGAADVCDGVDDNDCDEQIDPMEADADGDGLSVCEGDCDDADPDASDLDADGDGWSICGGDCDDGDDATYPGATELCDGLDNSCDGLLPGDEIDGDGDGFSGCAGDCDDFFPSIYPGAPEIAGDGVDQDCDGIDLAHADADGDGYDGVAHGGSDCDDSDPTVHPGAVEVCDGVDNDCEPATDELVDGDLDGYSVCDGDCDDVQDVINPTASEICDGRDDDCDGVADDACVTCNLEVPTDVGTIAAALAVAFDTEVVCVSPGTYSESLTFPATQLHVLGVGGPEVTVIDGGGGSRPATFGTYTPSQTILEGFTLTGGNAVFGGGIVLDSTAPTLRRLVITGNTTSGDGGGIYSQDSSATLVDVVVTGNTAAAGGGGIYLLDDSATLDNVIVVGNSAANGGGIYAVGCDLRAANLTVADNVAAGNDGGGGLMLESTGAELTNLIVTGNTAVLGLGGGLASRTYGETVTVTTAAIGGNSALYGGGLAVNAALNALPATLVDTIVWENTASLSGGGIYATDLPVQLSYCDLADNNPDNTGGNQGPVPGATGNISGAPLFMDTTASESWDWDLHLQASSPCVDAGDPALQDPDGGISDMGAYGGLDAGGFDRDLDGAPDWWQPGPYDAGTYPAFGWDCDDTDPSARPPDGC